MNGNGLTRAELASFTLGWSGAAWAGAHDTMEMVGGGLAGWISEVWSPKVAFAIGFPIALVNAFMGGHPIIRLCTSLGPGLTAGASAIATRDWLAQGKSRSGMRVAA